MCCRTVSRGINPGATLIHEFSGSRAKKCKWIFVHVSVSYRAGRNIYCRRFGGVRIINDVGAFVSHVKPKCLVEGFRFVVRKLIWFGYGFSYDDLGTKSHLMTTVRFFENEWNIDGALNPSGYFDIQEGLFMTFMKVVDTIQKYIQIFE